MSAASASYEDQRRMASPACVKNVVSLWLSLYSVSYLSKVAMMVRICCYVVMA